jgi:hypothetical protein
MAVRYDPNLTRFEIPQNHLATLRSRWAIAPVASYSCEPGSGALGNHIPLVGYTLPNRVAVPADWVPQLELLWQGSSVRSQRPAFDDDPIIEGTDRLQKLIAVLQI